VFTLTDLLADLAPGVRVKGDDNVRIRRAGGDSREAGEGTLFAALAGEHTDGHRYLEAACRAGAVVALAERVPPLEGALSTATVIDLVHLPCGGAACRASTGPVLLIVPNVLQALQRLAQGRRQARSDLRVVAVTGSVGKTTTKETIAAVLATVQPVLRSQGNQNNEIGLPLTLLALDATQRYAVLEMGMYSLGEIAALCAIAAPQIGVVTNVGPVHLERLGTIERIAQAKAELVQALPPDGVAVLNGDDPRVAAMRSQTRAHVVTFGRQPGNTVWAEGIRVQGLAGTCFSVHVAACPEVGLAAGECELTTAALGEQVVMSALPAVALGRMAGLDWPDIQRGLTSQGRGLRLVPVAGLRGSTLLDDSYNASPASTCAALRVLGNTSATQALNRRRIAALGDMLELGDYEEQGHREVGRCAADNVDMLITVGRRARALADEAGRAGLPAEQIHVLDDTRGAIALLSDEIATGDVILIKGSHSIGMGAIVEALKERQP